MSQIRVGDRVKLLEFGTGRSDWCPMPERFGDIVTVSEIEASGILFDDGEYGWPLSAVEFVSRDATGYDIAHVEAGCRLALGFALMAGKTVSSDGSYEPSCPVLDLIGCIALFASLDFSDGGGFLAPTGAVLGLNREEFLSLVWGFDFAKNRGPNGDLYALGSQLSAEVCK